MIEDQLAKYDDKINKEVAKAAKKFGESFDEAQFRSTNGRVLEHQAKRDALHTRFSKALNDNNLDELRQIMLMKRSYVLFPVLRTGRKFVSST